MTNNKKFRFIVQMKAKKVIVTFLWTYLSDYLPFDSAQDDKIM